MGLPGGPFAVFAYSRYFFYFEFVICHVSNKQNGFRAQFFSAGVTTGTAYAVRATGDTCGARRPQDSGVHTSSKLVRIARSQHPGLHESRAQSIVIERPLSYSSPYTILHRCWDMVLSIYRTAYNGVGYAASRSLCDQGAARAPPVEAAAELAPCPIHNFVSIERPLTCPLTIPLRRGAPLAPSRGQCGAPGSPWRPPPWGAAGGRAP